MNSEAWVGIVVAVVGLVGVVIGSVITSRATLAQAKQQQRWEHERIVRTKLEETYHLTYNIKQILVNRFIDTAYRDGKNDLEEMHQESNKVIADMGRLSMLIDIYTPHMYEMYEDIRRNSGEMFGLANIVILNAQSDIDDVENRQK